MTRMWRESHSGIASDTSSYPARCGAGRPGGGNPPPTPQGGQYLPGLFTKTLIKAPVPGSGVPGRVVKSDQPLDSLFAPPRAGYNCDPGRR